ncbi:MAG: phosphoribosylaminoimidazolesuccinocarboxamide synthase [Candidatus Dormibacteria bacterium]
MGSGRGLSEVNLAGVQLFRRGKVRDTFDLGDRLLMVATDRLSAFDCVLPDLIPDRGRVLTAMSRFWFSESARIVSNHLLADDPSVLPPGSYAELAGRMMFVAKADRVDIECVVRGHLAGSGWEEYLDRGTLADEALPEGLSFGAQLPTPRFTPATKSDSGHDQNISRTELAALVGPELALQLERTSLELYQFGAERCRRAGLILADTKFEFGFVAGRLTLIDELLTPDSSRLWEAGDSAGSSHGFDKQPVRDYLLGSGWNRQPPAPPLPAALVVETRRRYLEVCKRTTGIDL